MPHKGFNATTRCHINPYNTTFTLAIGNEIVGLISPKHQTKKSEFITTTILINDAWEMFVRVHSNNNFCRKNLFYHQQQPFE